MAKINTLHVASHSINKNVKKKKEKKSNKLFSSILSTVNGGKKSTIETFNEIQLIEEDITRENLSQLIDLLHKKGKKMALTKTMGDILDYKESVKSFMKFFVRNSLTIEKVKSRNRSPFSPTQNGNKEYSIIQNIDLKLENLAGAVLLHQQSNLEILSQVDEIKGMMLNLIA